MREDDEACAELILCGSEEPFEVHVRIGRTGGSAADLPVSCVYHCTRKQRGRSVDGSRGAKGGNTNRKFGRCRKSK